MRLAANTCPRLTAPRSVRPKKGAEDPGGALSNYAGVSCHSPLVSLQAL